MAKHTEAVSTSLVIILKRYKKAVASSLGTILAAYLVMNGDGAITNSEFSNLVVLAAGTIALAIAPNTPGAKYVKFILAGLAAVATVVISAYSGGISPDELNQIVVAAFSALGVRELPNEGDTLDRKTNVLLQEV